MAQVYLVGGAVRDELLGLAVRERDYVVVGSSPGDMTAAGFQQVGADFPVFLHPETGEEYALARTERKKGPGYHGFETRFSPDVTLEQDLERRDLTINAMARSVDGALIDPFDGQGDLQRRLLRHVSDAFVEDPVRILRVARFAARFHDLGFRVAADTMALMRRMVANGEVDALVAERVWQEMNRALTGPTPQVFFVTLRECGALARLLPELDRLFGVPQPPRHHPEVDTGLHTLMVLERAAALSADPVVRFAALTHDLGKGTTPPERHPKHHGHETRSVALAEAICARFKVPRRYRDLARLVARHHGDCHRALELRPATVLKLLEAVDAFRRPERLEQFLLACQADYQGRTGFSSRPYPQADHIRAAFARAEAVDTAAISKQTAAGPAIGTAIRKARLRAIAPD
ncbi:MAG: multifunctional CCA addition/repair protein [Pseudomonadota bacterium]|nr:multifunctional CCA addition/repair protein [Pseudomonadota bacterium]